MSPLHLIFFLMNIFNATFFFSCLMVVCVMFFIWKIMTICTESCKIKKNVIKRFPKLEDLIRWWMLTWTSCLTCTLSPLWRQCLCLTYSLSLSSLFVCSKHVFTSAGPLPSPHQPYLFMFVSILFSIWQYLSLYWLYFSSLRVWMLLHFLNVVF